MQPGPPVGRKVQAVCSEWIVGGGEHPPHFMTGCPLPIRQTCIIPDMECTSGMLCVMLPLYLTQPVLIALTHYFTLGVF